MNNLLEDFIFNKILIDPINDILTKLQNNEFRDCDVKWLNVKLEQYTSYALLTLNKKFDLDYVGRDVLNGHVKSRFIEYFTILLDYFKSLT